jgi:dienelactone hydrolase
MLQAFFHAWERRLASVTTDRVVRPFDWGLDWISSNGHQPQGFAGQPASVVGDWVSRVMADSDVFYKTEPTTDYALAPAASDGMRVLTFPSALTTPHAENNTVYARYFEPRYKPGRRRVAVIVLPQWNADAGGHIGLSRLLSLNGMAALRLSLPYHDWRMPPELHRADYIVSANVARTVQVCRQAVLDVRRAAAWLRDQGFERIGILGTSLGSCLALLSTAHEPLIQAQALNHISPYFADVVWRGLSTRHVREGLDGHIDLDLLRDLWKPISPWWYLDRVRDRRTLLVYARYDLSFPVDLSELLVNEFRARSVPAEVAVLPCGHYSTGKTPFKFVDGWILTRFLKRALLDQGN